MLAVLLSPPPGSAATYQVDPGRSELVVRLRKAGVAAAFAHDHVIRATRFSGRVELPSQDPTAGSVEIEVDTRSLRADEPAVRLKHGLDKPLDEKDRNEIQATMEGPGQLDVASHPTISFRSTSVEASGDGGYVVAGALTLHGTTQQIRFPAKIEVASGELVASGAMSFQQSAFGIEPYSGLGGAVRNRDEADLIVHLVAAASGAGAPADGGAAASAAAGPPPAATAAAAPKAGVGDEAGATGGELPPTASHWVPLLLVGLALVAAAAIVRRS